MKITPVGSQPTTTAGTDAGVTVSTSKRARAIQAAEGKQVSETPMPDRGPPQEEKTEQSLKRIKMKTQRSVYRDDPAAQAAIEAQPQTEQSNIVNKIEQDQSGKEETIPLDPQVALEMKYKRTLQKIAQEKDARIKDLEAKLAGGNTANFNPDEYIRISDIQANPLSIIEKGVTYDQLTEAVLSDQSNAKNPSFIKLQSEIAAVKASLEDQAKLQTERDELTKKQVLFQMEKDAQALAARSDEYELVRTTGAVKDVVRLIDKTYEKTGEVLDVDEAMKLVEAELENDAMLFTKSKKVMSKLGIAQTEQRQTQNQNTVRPMRTLTNRDNAAPVLDRRARAINAFYGRK